VTDADRGPEPADREEIFTIPDDSTRAAFDADLLRMNTHLLKLDAVHCAPETEFDEAFAWLDEEKVTPQFVSAYSALLSFGYANGFIPYDVEDGAA